jgi:hypothetical protein
MKNAATKHVPARLRRVLAHALSAMIVALCCARAGHAQVNANERTFPQSKATVEKVLKEMQAATAGRLPVLDGFATAADHPLDRYQRGYYQSKFQVSSTASGGSVVRVSVQVTAWYTDPVAARSGYQVLTSNGRLEADLLDQLADQLAGKAPLASASSPATPAHAKAPTQPTISAPVPRVPETGGFSSSLAQSLAAQEKNTPQTKLADKDSSALQAEAQSLEEILKNQAHPKNLVAVKKSGTPVVATASLTAKTLFLASAHDEFEMLDFNRDWVHVRISGLSRGWIWRNNLEMPDSVPDSDVPPNPSATPVAAELFHVTREEEAPFPGDWAPLRGKTVKIVSVEKINETKDAGPQLRLEFAKSVLDKDYAELAQKQALAGIVLIFDSVDGGMIAATLPTLQQWKAGKLSDAALWRQCFFDPPETFNASGSAASQ